LIELVMVSTIMSWPIIDLKEVGLYFSAKTLCVIFSITGLGAARPEICN